MKWIGLTGGIATGKSTVTQLIESRGYTVIDADRVSHQLTQFGEPGYEEIVSEFGQDILLPDLKIDRKKLSQIIFNNPVEKSKLEKIMHPLIHEKVESLKLINLQKGAKILFYDVPLLFENNLASDFDSNLVVWCDPEKQLERLIKRNSLTQDEAKQRIKAQMPLSEKISKATYCIDNSGSEYELILSVDVYLDQLLKDFSQRTPLSI